MYLSSTSLEPNRVQVSFEEGLTTQSVCERIISIKDAQVVLWYAGPYGLKEGAVDFYKKHFLSVIVTVSQNKVWLYDLTGWSAFQNPKGKITASSSLISQIDELKIPKIISMRSSDIFKEMMDLPNPTLDELRSRLTERKFVWDPSKNFTDKGIRLGDIFNNRCPLFEPYYETDTSKSYSIVQYAEGLFVIEKIVHSCEDSCDPINIIFALPNDETKYYKDGEKSFENDVNFFLGLRNITNATSRKVNILFLCFDFGAEISHRPYNIPGKVVKKIQGKDQIF